MPQAKKVLVVGASGLVGSAVAANLTSSGADFIAVSRNRPDSICPKRFIPVDLQDTAQCRQVFSEFNGITHLVYAALYEQSTLVAGWSDQQQIDVNSQMFRNVLDLSLIHI